MDDLRKARFWGLLGRFPRPVVCRTFRGVELSPPPLHVS
jgi:hypothetical protein